MRVEGFPDDAPFQSGQCCAVLAGVAPAPFTCPFGAPHKVRGEGTIWVRSAKLGRPLPSRKR
jgi:hypothetical protein